MKWFALIAIIIAALCAYVPGTLRVEPPTQTWLFFDGVCNLCDGFVNFVADHDSEANVKFGAIQRHHDLLKASGVPSHIYEDLDTVIVVQGDEYYTRSTAALRVLAMLDSPWRTLSAASVIPPVIRDNVYKLIAKYRYVVFGQAESCRAPTEAFKSRFLDYVPEPAEPFSA